MELLFLLRVLSAGALYLFLAVLGYFIWRDYRSAARQQARGRLVVLEGAEAVGLAVDRFPLLPLTMIGRAPTNTVVLPDSFASSEHAALTLRGGRWWLEDRQSANGTLLNDVSIDEPTVVSTGDIIGVGRVRLRVELD